MTTGQIHAQSPGNLSGLITDKATRQPVIGATIRLIGTDRRTMTNHYGRFELHDVAAGTWVVDVTMDGYSGRREPDVVVRANRTTVLDIELTQRLMTTRDVVVTASAFDGPATAQPSTITWSAEEVRRAPNGFGDPLRAMMNIPSVAQSEDAMNDLIVRGGSPVENGFYVDGVFIPNISHFPQQGGTGGDISILNMDFVQSMTLSAGGYDATYGDRMSAIVNIALRDGDAERHHVQADLNMTGFGGVIEGPITSNVSYLLGVRRSWVDILVAMLDVGRAPNFGDVQGKMTWRVHETSTVSLLSMFGRSEYSRSVLNARENGENTFGREAYDVFSNGLTWRSLWSDKLSTHTALGWSRTTSVNTWSNVADSSTTVDRTSQDDVLNLRSITTWLPNSMSSLDVGTEVRWQSTHNSDAAVGAFPELAYSGMWTSLFTSWRQSMGRLTTTVGLRGTYYGAQDRIVLDPRLRVNYEISERLWLSVSGGIIHQQLPAPLLAQAPENVRLPIPQIVHVLAGCYVLLDASTKLSIELYDKRYSNLPSSALVPYRLITDDVVGDVAGFDIYGPLTSSITARAYGVEAVVQRRSDNGWYWTAGASWLRSDYTDAKGVRRNRTFDNQLILTAVVGWTPDDKWFVSGRWGFSGGRAITPIDVVASRESGETILNISQWNAERLPAYHTLSVRADRKFFFSSSSLTVYLSIVNAYNRRNARQMYFDVEQGTVRQEDMWGVIPVFGVEWEL